MRPEPGKIIGARYRLEHPLAAGGMGTVWVATHRELDVKVAVKFMADEIVANPSRRARFEREAKAAARLQGAHVVRAYDYGFEQGTPYMAMELLRGESLEERLDRRLRLSTEEVATILRQAAKGLEEAHELGIVHRDLKPDNIFMARVGQEEVVKILDFGIAKETIDPMVDEPTASGTLLGSPQYMSPEQARGGTVDARSDLWSLAVVVFRALTGEWPFTGETISGLFRSIFVLPVPPASQWVPELGPAVDDFFERALARNPDLRFGSASEMADMFDAVIEGKGMLPAGGALARSGPTREMRPARSRAAPAIALGVTAFVALAYGAYVAWPSDAPPAAATAQPKVELPAPPSASITPTSSSPAASASAAPSTILRRDAPPRPRPTASSKSDDPFFD